MSRGVIEKGLGLRWIGLGGGLRLLNIHRDCQGSEVVRINGKQGVGRLQGVVHVTALLVSGHELFEHIGLDHRIWILLQEMPRSPWPSPLV